MSSLSKEALTRSQGQGTSLPSASLDAGSVAKYLDHGVELEQVQEKQAESFLGRRPEPPPPPDTGGEKDGLSTFLETTSLPTSPRAESKTMNRGFSDAEISNKTQTPSALPSSPTAVAFRFRQPGRSSSTARSLSQTPLPSNQSAADQVPKQKPRPHSTDFKSSKITEIRPLWLVERRRSDQEPTFDEVYPSLPSSHTTSRSSSVDTSEEREQHQKGPHELDDAVHQPIEVEHAPMRSIDQYSIRSDLLDSQKATSIAHSFHHSTTALDMPSPTAPRDPSLEAVVEHNPHHSSSTVKNAILSSILGGSAAVAMNETIEKDVPLRQNLTQEENEEFERGLDDTGLDTVTYPSHDDNLDQEDLSPQKPKKGKKNRRKADQSRQGTFQSSLTEAAEAKLSTAALNPDSLSPEAMRQIQEQDVQDAVDSWSPSVRSSTKAKRGKKGKNRMLVERLPVEGGLSPDTHEPPGNDLGTMVSAEGHEDISLTRGMSRKQVVDIMTATAQDTGRDEDEASQFATFKVQAPAKIIAEEDESKLKDQEGNRGQTDLPQNDLEQDDLPRDIIQRTTFPTGDILQDDVQTKTLPPHDNPHENLAQDDLPEDNVQHDEPPQLKGQQNIQHQDDSLQASSPQDDFSQSHGQQALSLHGDSQPGSLPAFSSSSAQAVAPFIDPFLLTGHAGPIESPKTNPLSEEFNRGELVKSISPQLELSPRATPLPDGDDALLDEVLGTPVLTPLDRYDDDERGVAAENQLDASHLQDPSAITSRPQGQSQDLPSQADQIDAAESFTAPSKESSEKGEMAKQSFSVEDNKTADLQGNRRPLSDVITPTTLEDDLVKGLNDVPAAEVLQGKAETMEDDSRGLTNSELGKIEKETRQSSPAENSKTLDMYERQESLPQKAASEVLEDHKTVRLMDESAVNVVQAKNESDKEGLTGFNDKMQSTNREEVNPNFSVGNTKTTSFEEDNESLSKLATLEDPEYCKSIDLIGELRMHIPESELVQEVPKTPSDEFSDPALKPKMPEDEWAGVDGKKAGKQAQDQGSKTLYLGPEPKKAEIQSEQQSGQQSDARVDVNDSTSFSATMQPAQVSAKLGPIENEAPVEDRSKETFLGNSQTGHNLQKPSEGRTIGPDEREMPMLLERETSQLEFAPGKAHDDAKSSGPDTFVASTNTAQAVQDLLVGKNNPTSATDVKTEAMAVSTGMKDATTDSPMDEEELDWNAPKKKKKGKKGKKNEVAIWDDPEISQPADVSSPPRTVDSRLEQEPVVNRPIEEDELILDAPKKKKKGKKGKKNEVFTWDEPKAVEQLQLFDPPPAIKPPLLEQGVSAEANDEVFPKQSKKDKKNKKGKRKGVSRITDDFRDEDEPSVVPTEISQDKELPAIASDVQEEYKASDILTEVSQNDPKAEELHSRNEVEPGVVPTEILHDDDEVKKWSAIDHPVFTSVVREESGPTPVTAEAPLDNDKVEDVRADFMLPNEAEISVLGETSNTVEPTGFAQGNKNKASREASLDQEEYSIPSEGRKNKKKSKGSKKSNAFSLGDAETFTPEDGQGAGAGAKILENGELEQTTPSAADTVVESETSVPKIRPEQEENLSLPLKKKDRKKSKKYTAFSLDNDVLPPPEDEPISQHKYLEGEVLKQTLSSSVGVVKEPGTIVEALPENQDRDKTEEVQPATWKSENLSAQSEPEPTEDPNKESGTDSRVNPTKPWGELGMVEGNSKLSTQEGFNSILAHDALPEISNKTSSSVRSSLEQSANVPEETLTDDAENLKGNIDPLVKTDVHSSSIPKPSKKDKKKAKKAQSLIWKDDEVSQEPRAIFNQSSAFNDVGEPPINPVSQHSEPWSKSEMSAQEVESIEIIPQDVRLGEDQGHQGTLLNETPSQVRHNVQTIVEADPDDSFVNVEKSNMGEIADNEKHSVAVEKDGSPADGKEFTGEMATSPVHGSEQMLEEQPNDDVNTAGAIQSDDKSAAVGLEKGQVPISTDPEAFAEAKDEGSAQCPPVQIVENPGRPQDEAQWDEPRIEDLSSSVAPRPAQEPVETIRNMENVADIESLEISGKDKPIPKTEVEMLDAKEQREYNEEYARELKRAIPTVGTVADPQPLVGPYTNVDKPIPTVEVEMLNAQEQRNYNEEYAKELERQLSPLHEGARDEAKTPPFSQSSIHSVVERPYEEEHRPLARPPALEDIIEESGSRPGSSQDTPVGQEGEFPPIKSNKKGKKGKRSKKQQPIIWEDETATPPLESESDQGAKPSVRPSEGSGPLTTKTPRPLDLEEPVRQQAFDDRTTASPTRGSNTSERESEITVDRSGDYFTIQPNRSAEEDVGREDTREFRQVLATEKPYTDEGPFPAQDTQADQDYDMSIGAFKTDDQDEEPAPVVADFHVKSRSEVEPASEQIEDDSNPAPTTTMDESTKPEEEARAREPPPQVLKHEDVMDPDILDSDTQNASSPSRRYSLAHYSHKDELSSVADGRSTSQDKSESIEEVAAAVGLGVGALAAESLSMKDSKIERRHGEKAKDVGSSTDFRNKTGGTEDALDSLDKGQIAAREQEHRRTPESSRAWQHDLATPPRSPPSANHRAFADHSVEDNLVPSSETPEYRDSAMYVSGSPIVSEEIPHHHTTRDSGYPDTETCPTIDDEVEILDASGKLERPVTADEKVGHVQRRHSGAQGTELQRPTSGDPLSVKAVSDYDVSESGPRERRKRSRRRSGVAYDSDDSADSGFDIQRRRRRQAMAAEPREPSPVSSTTKDRSSALFDSSPSAREDIAVKVQHRDLSPHYGPMGEKPTWSFDREASPQHRSQELSVEGRSSNITEDAPGSTDYSRSTDHHEARGISLFGGPQNYDDDMLSPSRSRRSSEGRGRQRLNTISEDSADGSPLRRKDKRALSDVGSPESGVKGRRIRSPPVEAVEEDDAREYTSTYESISHQPWSAADEEEGAMDERSRSRNSDQLSTLSSRHSGRPGAAFGQREEEHRTASAGSMRSEKNNLNNNNHHQQQQQQQQHSIHAIIRTPDQVRSASGLSYRSSGSRTITPPLRRVDRSASGDLRGASKNDEAKSRTKISSEFNDPDPNPDLDFANISSSSTYDPVTGKGKSRANMTDVYVSSLLYSIYIWS